MSRASKIFNSPTIVAPDSVNKDGFPAYARPADEQYLQMLLTNTLGRTFYATEKELLKDARATHEAFVKEDPDFAAKAIVYARNRGFMRTQPLLGLAYLSAIDPAKFRKVAPLVWRTPNDLADFTAMVQDLRTKVRDFNKYEKGKQPTLRSARTRSEGGRAIKTAAGKWLAARLSEYWAIKYGRSSSDGNASLADLIRIYHPDFGRHNDVVAYLLGTGTERMKSRLSVHWDKVPQLGYFEEYKTASTEEQRIACITKGRLPHEVVTALPGMTKKVWDALAPQMPTFALLRNLKTLEKSGVLDNHRKLVEEKLSDPVNLRKAKVLPYRLLEAMKHTSSNWVKDALRRGIDGAMDNLPPITGKTAVLLDRSPSMDGQFTQVAAIFALGVIRQAKLNGQLILFSGEVARASVSGVDSVLSQAETIANWHDTLGGTNTGGAMQVLVNDHAKYDNIVLITDGQQNMGQPFAKVYAEYQMRVNRESKLFVVDVSPYKNGVMPELPDVTYLYGWSDYTLEYLAFATEGWASMAARVRAGDPGQVKEREAEG